MSIRVLDEISGELKTEQVNIYRVHSYEPILFDLTFDDSQFAFNKRIEEINSLIKETKKARRDYQENSRDSFFQILNRALAKHLKASSDEFKESESEYLILLRYEALLEQKIKEFRRDFGFNFYAHHEHGCPVIISTSVVDFHGWLSSLKELRKHVFFLRAQLNTRYLGAKRIVKKVICKIRKIITNSSIDEEELHGTGFWNTEVPMYYYIPINDEQTRSRAMARKAQ